MRWPSPRRSSPCSVGSPTAASTPSRWTAIPAPTIRRCCSPTEAATGVSLMPSPLPLQAAADGEWLTLAEGGATAHPDTARARAIFRHKTIRLRIDLGVGRAEAMVWTCDLTPDYVRINADYTS